MSKVTTAALLLLVAGCSTEDRSPWVLWSQWASKATGIMTEWSPVKPYEGKAACEEARRTFASKYERENPDVAIFTSCWPTGTTPR